MSTATANAPMTIGIVLFPDAEELDWAGPYEVFGMAVKMVENARVVTIAETTANPVAQFLSAPISGRPAMGLDALRRRAGCPGYEPGEPDGQHP